MNEISFDIAINRLCVSFRYDRELVSIMHRIPSHVWDAQNKRWTFDVSDAKKLFELLPTPMFSRTSSVATLEAKLQADELAAQQALQQAQGANLDGLFGTRKLFEHQKEAVRDIVTKRRLVLAHEMGLGKTTSALVGASLLPYPIVIVAPVSLHRNWRREISILDLEDKDIKIYSWQNIPDPFSEPFTLIADEAHYAQNMKSARTKKFLTLAVPSTVTILLTGTPMKNGRPANLFPLLKAIDHTLSHNRRYYESYFCGAGPTQWSKWDANKVQRDMDVLHSLHEQIRDHVIVRKTDDCLDLPEETRILKQAALEGEAKNTFYLVFNTLKAEYARRRKSGQNYTRVEAITMLHTLRQAASWAKLHTAVDMADELKEEGRKVVFFTFFKDTAKGLFDYLKPLGRVGLVTSDYNPDTRDEVVQTFQRGELDFLVCTIGVGGVGLNMTAASTAVLVDRPWTPSDTAQCECRIRRIGQDKPCMYFWLQIHECDERTDQIILSKQQAISKAMSDTEDTFEFDKVIEPDYVGLLSEIFG